MARQDNTITPKDLNNKIKSGKLGGIFFFYGEEQYRMENAISAIAKKIVPKGTEAFNLFRFDGLDVSAAEVLETVDQYPQMSDRKLVVVRDSGLLNNAVLSDFKLIKNAYVSDDTCLIFAEKSFDKKKLKNLDFISNSGGIVLFEHMTEKELTVWIEKKFRAVDKSAADKEILYIINLCGRSLAAIDQACEKLINYTDKRNKITRDDVDAVVEKSVEYLVYDMVESITDRRFKAAWEQLDYLKKTANGKSVRRKTADGKVMRIDPNYILGLIMSQLSELLCCKLLRDDGLSAQEIGKYFEFQRPIFAVNKSIQRSRNFDEDFLQRMVDLGLHYDVECKLGKLAPWAAVEMYMTELLNGR